MQKALRSFFQYERKFTAALFPENRIRQKEGQLQGIQIVSKFQQTFPRIKIHLI